MDYEDEVIDDGANAGHEDKENEQELASSDDEHEEDDAEDGPVDVHKFLDNEAELSGEGSSDEEEGEDDDKLEDNEEADNDDVGDESEQREGIAKIFHKQQADEDKRQLLLYQEKMFEDGDLHMNGKQRQRKFRWRNTEATWIDPHDRSSDEEDGEDGGTVPPLRSDEVIIHLKKDFPAENQDSGDATSAGKAGHTQREPLRTIPMPVFGGNAGSILSYIVRDKKTCDILSSVKQSSPSYAKYMTKTVLKHKIRTKSASSTRPLFQ